MWLIKESLTTARVLSAEATFIAAAALAGGDLGEK